MEITQIYKNLAVKNINKAINWLQAHIRMIDITGVDKDKNTLAILLADFSDLTLTKNRIILFRELSKHGLDCFTSGAGEDTPLMKAVSHNNMDLVVYLVEEVKVFIEFQSMLGDSALAIADNFNRPEIANYLRRKIKGD